jgi:hypothetical protein
MNADLFSVGDTLSMIVCNGEVFFEVNGNNLGLAFSIDLYSQ